MELDNEKPLPEYGWEWDIYFKLQDFFYEYHQGNYKKWYKEKYRKHFGDYCSILTLFKCPNLKTYFLPPNVDYFTEKTLIEAFEWVYARMFFPDGRLVSSVLAKELEEKEKLERKNGKKTILSNNQRQQAVDDFFKNAGFF